MPFSAALCLDRPFTSPTRAGVTPYRTLTLIYGFWVKFHSRLAVAQTGFQNPTSGAEHFLM